MEKKLIGFYLLRYSSGNTQNYINNIQYDEFGSRTYFEYGNGVSSAYIYNSATRRLQNLSTTATNGNLHNITYTYDPVGNITNITNTATGADGLGGSFTYNYSYDDLYRLDSSDGSGSIDAAYTLAMAYSPSGNILTKEVQVNKELLGNASFEQYYNEYSYSGAHTLGMVNDALGNIPALHYNFDANGNMITQQRYNDNSGIDERYLCWDEENRLSATRDNNYVTANIYDASGNRAWKLAGEMNWMWQNGSGWQGYGDLNLRTWYQSELMTITDVGFTKHYFIAGQKIASKLGEGLMNSDVLPPLQGETVKPIHSEYSELARAQVERLRRDFDCLGVNYDNFSPGGTYFELLRAAEETAIGEESNVYFYHSDHLGSSSFLTDGSGFATQHLQYMPFGEDLVHQQNTAAYYTPYTFSGKERDMETGLSYFGARYYDASLSIWLSVDPMSDKGPHLSPYNYCFNNPIWYRDPDGKWPTPETVWDVINVAMGVGSFATNVTVGNYWGAALDAVGIAYDAVATSVPILPAGGSTAIGIYRLSNLTKKTLGAVDAARSLFDGNKNYQNLNKALKKAYNSVSKETDLKSLEGAIKEKLGIPLEVIKKEAKDGKFDHTTKVEQGIRSMETAVLEIDKVLKAGNLTKKEAGVLKNTRDLLIERSNKLHEILKTAEKLSKTLE